MAQHLFSSLKGLLVDTTICSCTQCNNDKCLGKRQETASCSCEDCTQHATCLLYNKNKKRSIGCGATCAANNPTLLSDIGDGYENKVRKCCDGKTQLLAPGHVFKLPKYCTECGSSALNISKSPRHVTSQCESSRHILELPKQHDYECNKCMRIKEKESPKNACDQTKCLQKPHAKLNSHDCSVKKKYKSPAYILEPSPSIGKDLPGIVYDLKKVPQKNCPTCNEPAKIKSDSFVCMTVLQQNSIEYDENNICIKRNDDKTPHSECRRTKPQIKKSSQESCVDCTNTNKNETLRISYEPTKTQKPRSQINSTAFGSAHKSEPLDLSKYVLDLRKKYSKHNDKECHLCARSNKNDLLRNLKTQNSCCGCGHDSNKYAYAVELPNYSHQKSYSSKSTTTCSSECCPMHKKSSSSRELIMSTSIISQLYNKKSKESITCSETQGHNKCQCLKNGSKISLLMSDTLKKQESLVETQKGAYLRKSGRILSPAAIYAAMTKTQKEQNSAVQILKSAYLPQSSISWTPFSSKKKCVCKHDQRPDRTKEPKKIIPVVTCKHMQELINKKQCFKESNTTNTKSCTCKKGKESSVAKTSNQELQLAVVDSFETDNVTICPKCGPKKKIIAEKCKCKHKNKENIQIYWSTNGAPRNAGYGPLRKKQGSQDYLPDIANYVELPKILPKKNHKLDIKNHGSRKNLVEIQYIPFMRSHSCNSENIMAELPSNALCIGLSTTDQNSNTVKCTVSDITKISSSSKTKTAQGSEKYIQLFNVNRLETNRFTPDKMHIFYNTSNESNEQYTPTKNAQELFKNILQIHGDEIEALINRYQKKPGENITFTKDIESESSRHSNELPQSSHMTVKQSGSAENNSKSSGCFSKPQSYKTSESAGSAKEFCINRLEVKPKHSYTSIAQKSDKNGYVIELPKCMPTTQKIVKELSKNDKHEKKKCGCSNSAKYKPEKQGSVTKISTEASGYVLDLPIHTQKCHSCSFTQLANKPSICGNDTANNAPNNADVLNVLKLVSKSIQSDTENIYKGMVGTQTDIIENLCLQNPVSENTIDLCKDILKTQINTIEVLKKIYFPQIKNTFESSQNTCNPVPKLIDSSDNINKNKNNTMQPETAKLSVIKVLGHISYTEPNDSLTCRQSNMSIKPKKISKYDDIIKRLKEAYKACSCKICECVANKAAKPSGLQAVTCNCKPCECNLCTSLLLKHEKDERQICDCKPCDCVQCTLLAQHLRNDSSQTTKAIGFHQRQTFVVAPVEIDNSVSHGECTCSPCRCIECGLIYPLGSTLINEMSTSTNRHALCRCEVCLNENCDRNGFDSCKCQMRNKVMSKPVEHDTHDFDIRTAMIVHNTPISQRACRNDPITMFAAVPNAYSTLQNRPSNRKICSCKQRKCMFCFNQKEAVKSAQLLYSTSRKKSNFNFINRTENCDLPNEWQFNKEIQSHDFIYDKYSGLNCETKSLKYSSNESHRFEKYRNDTYGPCYIKKTPGSVRIPFKKGDVLTPSTHKLKMQDQILQRQRLEAHSISKVSTNTDFSSNKQDFEISHELTTTELNTSNKIGSSTQANMYMNNIKTKYIDKCKTLKYDAYMYCQEINKKSSLNNNVNSENISVPGSCFSDHSSFCHKSSINTQITQSNNKSRETFYSSSGHKYPECVIEYSQKGTIETSIKDVVQLDMNGKRIHNCNFITNNIEKLSIDKMYESMSGDENVFKINNSDKSIIETLRCNYKFGLSNNLRLQLSNKTENTYRKKNEIQHKKNDQLQGEPLTGSQYSIKINNENSEYLKAINDFNEFHVAHKVFDYNMSARQSLTIHDEHSDLVTTSDILNANDYRRVKNTLNEAREFSQELIKLLKTYEKANNEFQSTSDKLKLTHESLLNSDHGE